MRKLHSTGGFWLVLGALLLAASLRLLFWFLWSMNWAISPWSGPWGDG